MDDNKMTTTELRATWGLAAVYALRMLGMFMILPVMATYGMALQGATEALIGLAIGAYGLAQIFFQIPVGFLSDRFGRKPIIVGGLLIFCFGSVVAAFSSSIWGVILGRFLQGSGVISAVVMAQLSDLTREQNRTKAMASIGVSIGVSFAIATVLGPIITSLLGLNGLFWISAILSIGSIIVTLWVVPDSQVPMVIRESERLKSSFYKVLAEPKLLKLNFGILCLHTILMFTFIAFPSQLESAGLRPADHWRVYLFTALISFVAIIPFIFHAEVRRNMKQVFIGCVIALLVAQIILWGAGSAYWQLIIGIQLYFFAFNLMESLLPSLIVKEAPAGYKGTAMGIYSTSQFLGVAIGGALGGLLDGMYDSQMVFLASAVIAAVWLMVSTTMTEPPYVTSLQITLPETLTIKSELKTRLLAQPGVSEVNVCNQQHCVYVKVDTKLTNRQAIEQLVKS